jgi:hypothetical protein
MQIDQESDGQTTIAGAVRDQAALHGILGRIRDLGLTLVAVSQGNTEPAPESSETEAKE